MHSRNFLRTIAVSGIVLFLGAVLYSLFFDITLELPIEAFFSMAPVWLVLAYGILIAPPLEEYSFRSWQKNSNKRQYVAPILFLLFSLGTNIVFISMAVITVIIYWLYFQKIHPVVIIIPTSILFAVGHLPVEDYGLDFWVMFAGYLGGALLFSYIRIKYSLKTSILVHALWNFTALYLLNFNQYHFKTQELDLSTAVDKIKLKRYSVFDFQLSNSSNYGMDKVNTEYSSSQEILSSLLHNDDSTIVTVETFPLTFYSLDVSTKNGDINYNEVVKKLIPVFDVRLDTTIEERNGYMIFLENKNLLQSDSKGTSLGAFGNVKMQTSVYAFAKELQERYAVPFFSADTTAININFNEQLSLSSQLENLKKKGFQLKPVKRRMKILSVTED